MSYKVDPNKDARPQGEDAVKKMRGKLAFAKAVALSTIIELIDIYLHPCTHIIIIITYYI